MADDHIIFAWQCDPSRIPSDSTPQKIYEHLHEQIYSPNPLRSRVITLHLYVEHWLDKIYSHHGLEGDTFYWKVKKLNDLEVFEEDLYENLMAINRLRNIYAHELDLDEAEKKVASEMKKLKLDPYFTTSDGDFFRGICIQTMFLLEATFNNKGKKTKIPSFPHEEIKTKLRESGSIHWAECELLSKSQTGHIVKWEIRCPLCVDGVIEREKNNTPGFKESHLGRCDRCGLTGEGNSLELKTQN